MTFRAHSKTEYKRLVTQGANVLPPNKGMKIELTPAVIACLKRGLNCWAKQNDAEGIEIKEILKNDETEKLRIAEAFIMTNVSKAMDYATTFEREAMREKLDAALGDLDHMNLIQLEAMVLHHAQQIKDIAKHLLELQRYMEFKRRAWVGLTEEEKHDCYLKIDVWSRCVEAVEAKLKEKNT